MPAAILRPRLLIDQEEAAPAADYIDYLIHVQAPPCIRRGGIPPTPIMVPAIRVWLHILVCWPCSGCSPCILYSLQRLPGEEKPCHRTLLSPPHIISQCTVFGSHVSTRKQGHRCFLFPLAAAASAILTARGRARLWSYLPERDPEVAVFRTPDSPRMTLSTSDG